MDVLAYALAKKYTSDTADRLGSLKGAPATIKSVTEITGGHRITFEWTGTSGAKQTQTLDVMDGEQGPQGEPGSQGEQGPAGPQGEKGADGTMSFDDLTPEQKASLKGDPGEKGDTGEKGADGAKGDDGYSPTITVTEITGGHRVTVTDATGSQSFDVMDGQGGDAKAFIAEYNVTTAQEINAFIDSANEPFPPILIKRGNDYYTAITAQKQAENKVILRSFASLSGDYYVFMYTITDGSWSASNYPFQKKGDAYTKTETDALLENKAAQSSVVALQNATESLRIANEATEAELTDFKSDIAIDLGGIAERLGAYEAAIAAKQDKPVYVVDKPEGSSPVSGNVVQVGSFVNTDGTEYGIYEFYYKTSALPAADTAKTYSFSPLLDDYTIFDFIDQSGITSNGHVISSGRTDGTNRIIIQQFSKNNKNVMLRAYGDYTAQTALLRIKFIGAKTV